VAIKINIDFKKLPRYVKVIISIAPSLIILIVVVTLLILPKNKEIKALESKISAQVNEIAKNESKASKLSELTSENERLKKRLIALKEQLPEEKEVSGLLKQVSDLCIKCGLQIVFWKPEQRKTHPSGIVYEIPVKVELTGSYHNLGDFFSNLTRFSRIINLSEIRLSQPTKEKENVIVRVAFTATTFSAIPGEETGKGK
jgi:type IV pilus assembly protein PilO